MAAARYGFVIKLVKHLFLIWRRGNLELAPPFGQTLQFAIFLGAGTQLQQIVGGAEFRMFHQLPRAFALAAGHAQLQLPDIAYQRGNTLRNGQRTAGFIQHIVHCQGESVVIGQTALLGDFLRHFQQRIPEHDREQERRVNAHIVANAVSVFFSTWLMMRSIGLSPRSVK